MAKGLQARWDLTDANEKKEGYDDIAVNSKEYQDMMKNYINAELKVIQNYPDEKFEDSNLKEIAVKYVNLLTKHMDICKYMTVDYDKYAEEFDPIYNERSKIISQMVEEYGMTVDESHQDTLDEFLTNSQLVEEQEDMENQIEKMLANIQFQAITDDGSGYKTYQAVVENTTGVDFNSFNVTINLLSADGVIVESLYDSVNAFTNGAKAQLEFCTDKEFASTQVISEYWD